jgi:subtilisin family serine protease
VPGAGIDAAHSLLAGRRPGREVIVAIVDSGVDITHEDLDDVLWVNEDEVPGNGIDDDRNGYVDDVHGWNFIGGPDGRSVNYDTFEMTRLHAACIGAPAAGPLPSPDPALCAEAASAYEEEVAELTDQAEQIAQITEVLLVVTQIMRVAVGSEPDVQSVTALIPTDARTAQAREIYLDLAAAGIDAAAIAEQGEMIQGLLSYGMDTAFDPRLIVGDDYTNLADRSYGNADVTGPDAGHGTAVASVVAAERSNGVGIEGIADGVRIMIVRAVPNGDERDKDVANAIRYAVDNGAHIINMSFGKGFSPHKEAVDAAVRYADEHGVLMVHAAGNDGANLADTPNFPSDRYNDGGTATLWIEVGALDWEGPSSLAASFSNYGAAQVDLFAPGVAILSAAPGNEYRPVDGTSIASPVVTGVAALLMAYFPALEAQDVRQILLETIADRRDAMVVRPGSFGESVPFGELSVTGGILDAEAAVRAALANR